MLKSLIRKPCRDYHARDKNLSFGWFYEHFALRHLRKNENVFKKVGGRFRIWWTRLRSKAENQ